MSKACRTCKHYSALVRECRVNPPTVFFIGVNQKGEPVASAFFPTMPADGWCGKYESDLNLT